MKKIHNEIWDAVVGYIALAIITLIFIAQAIFPLGADHVQSLAALLIWTMFCFFAELWDKSMKRSDDYKQRVAELSKPGPVVEIVHVSETWGYRAKVYVMRNTYGDYHLSEWVERLDDLQVMGDLRNLGNDIHQLNQLFGLTNIAGAIYRGQDGLQRATSTANMIFVLMVQRINRHFEYQETALRG